MYKDNTKTMLQKEIRIASCLNIAHIVVYCPHKTLAPIEHYLLYLEF